MIYLTSPIRLTLLLTTQAPYVIHGFLELFGDKFVTCCKHSMHAYLNFFHKLKISTSVEYTFKKLSPKLIILFSISKSALNQLYNFHLCPWYNGALIYDTMYINYLMVTDSWLYVQCILYCVIYGF